MKKGFTHGDGFGMINGKKMCKQRRDEKPSNALY
jgi:hypothetical protein